jgi:hypothetical protein
LLIIRLIEWQLENLACGLLASSRLNGGNLTGCRLTGCSSASSGSASCDLSRGMSSISGGVSLCGRHTSCCAQNFIVVSVQDVRMVSSNKPAVAAISFDIKSSSDAVLCFGSHIIDILLPRIERSQFQQGTKSKHFVLPLHCQGRYKPCQYIVDCSPSRVRWVLILSHLQIHLHLRLPAWKSPTTTLSMSTCSLAVPQSQGHFQNR